VERPIESVFDLAYKLSNLVIRRLPKEFAGKNCTNIITQDGYDESPEGVINFYAEKFTKESISNVLQTIKYFIPELGGQLTAEPRADISKLYGGLVYRIPVKITSVSDSPPEMNLSNVNAAELLRMLNISLIDDLYGSIDVRELAMKLATLTDFSIQMSAQAPDQGVGDSGARWYDGGRSMQQVERYIQTLNAMVQWAIENHYDTIQFS
jgi:hypothetical protein